MIPWVVDVVCVVGQLVLWGPFLHHIDMGLGSLCFCSALTFLA